MADNLQTLYAGFFDSSLSTTGILPQQISITEPLPEGLSTATGMLATDDVIERRLRHFPSDLYDIRRTTHLYRFMAAVLGDSGIGGWRKQLITAQLSTTASGSHFYDLDAFWGSLLGAVRTRLEQLTFDPMTGLATSDEWDDVQARDTSYRERIVALAEAVNMGGTPSGIQQAAEALIGVEVDIYEIWNLLDGAAGEGSGGPNNQRTWSLAKTFLKGQTAWGGLKEARTNWAQLENALTVVPGTGELKPFDAEVVIRPKKTYAPVGTETEYDVLRRREEDIYSLRRVLNRLKPAGTLITIDEKGVRLASEAPVTSVAADSNYWEITTRVVPTPTLNQLYAKSAYPVSSAKAFIDQEVAGVITLPTPPLSKSQGTQINHNNTIVKMSSYSYSSSVVNAPFLDPVTKSSNFETVLDARGRTVEYTPDQGISDSFRELAATAAANGGTVAHPFAGPRQVVTT